MKKHHREIVLPIDEQRRKRILALLEDAVRNAPIPFPKEEMTRLLREVNTLKTLRYKESIRQLKQLLSSRKRKPGKVSPSSKKRPWSLIYGRSGKGRKHK